jgi:uncharacterized RDD family membrane protein YckC
VQPVQDRDAPEVPAGLELATFGRRAIGTILDQVLVIVPVLIGAFVAGLRPGDEITDDTVLVLGASAVGLAFVYETIAIALTGRTVGKLVAGTRVVRRDDGERVGWFEAAQRSVVPLAASAVPDVGFLLGGFVYAMAFFHPLRQGVHDRAAGTIVVRR